MDDTSAIDPQVQIDELVGNWGNELIFKADGTGTVYKSDDYPFTWSVSTGIKTINEGDYHATIIVKILRIEYSWASSHGWATSEYDIGNHYYTGKLALFFTDGSGSHYDSNNNHPNFFSTPPFGLEKIE